MKPCKCKQNVMAGKTVSSLNLTWCSRVGGVYVRGSMKKMGDHFSLLNLSADLLNNFGLGALSSCVCFLLAGFSNVKCNNCAFCV